MPAILQDLRHAVRVFARRPALTVVAVLSLAVATGPNAALFGLIHGLFFRHLAVDRPDQLVAIRAKADTLTYADWLDIKQRALSLSGVAAWERVALPLSLDARTELVTGNYVSADYFTTLGLLPAAGRLFSPELDGHPQTELPLVISHSYWRRRFAGAASAIGTVPQIAGRAFVIVGVAPEGFRGLDFQFPVDGWIPLSAAEATGRLNAAILADREHGRLETVLGRLKPGATVDQARGEVDRIGRDLIERYPAIARGRVLRTSSYDEDRAARGLQIGGVVLALVGLVLLVACANVAGLLLALADVRRREVALRLALGASRSRLIRQFLTEAVLLWLAGAVAGLVLGAWLMHIPLTPPIGTAVLDYDIHFDTSVYLYTIGVSLLTAIGFGLAPALHATRADAIGRRKRHTARSSSPRPWARSALVTGQIAIAQLLLAGAVIGVRSYLNVQEFRPGFDVQKHLLIITLAPRQAGEPGPPGRRAELVDRLRSIRGVVNVSGAASVPLSGSGAGAIRMTSWPGLGGGLRVRSNSIAPNYFSVMGIRVLTGRDFDARDSSKSAPSVIVNETLARQIAPDGSAVGRWIRVENTPRQVVGVAEDGRYRRVRDQAEPYLYLPASSPGLLLIETMGDGAGVTEAVHRTVAQVMPDLYVADTTTLHDVIRFSRYADVLGAWLVGGLGLLAAFLTAVGVYGMVAHSVTSRTREFGIRMALGAERRQILAMVLRQGLRLAAIGGPIGVVAAVIGGGLLSSLYFRVSPLDPSSYFAGAAVLLVVVAMASLSPARRASEVEPASALRHE